MLCGPRHAPLCCVHVQPQSTGVRSSSGACQQRSPVCAGKPALARYCVCAAALTRYCRQACAHVVLLCVQASLQLRGCVAI